MITFKSHKAAIILITDFDIISKPVCFSTRKHLKG